MMTNFKFPMSVKKTLPATAINLFSIAGSLRQSARLDSQREICILMSGAFIAKKNILGAEYGNRLYEKSYLPKGSNLAGAFCESMKKY